MTRDEIHERVLRILGRVAPDADLGTLRPESDLRRQLDIDSLDFLEVIISFQKELGVEVPEADYSKLATLRACVDYLAARLGAS